MPAPASWRELPDYPVTAGTMVLAVGVTAAFWLDVDISPVFTSAEIRRGELWRLVTDIFPHGGTLHLLFNLYWTWIFGTMIEQVLGHFKTAALFLLLAVGASALEFAFLRGGIGLSGVGYGLFGFLWIASRSDDRFRDAIDQRTVVTFLLWFVFCIITTVTNIMPIANLEHGGGLALGVLTATAMAVPQRRLVAIFSLTALMAFALWGATVGRPRVNVSGKGGYEEFQWGYKALAANRNEEAARWLRDATRFQPNDAVYWYDLGVAYARMGKLGPAAAAFERAHQLEPDNPDFVGFVKEK
jgi:membrane associated rhomboid family serine protease